MNLISKCPVCDTNKEYSLEFDAQYCPSCNTWLESKCDKPDCEYCSYRPETPNG